MKKAMQTALLLGLALLLGCAAPGAGFSAPTPEPTEPPIFYPSTTYHLKTYLLVPLATH